MHLPPLRYLAGAVAVAAAVLAAAVVATAARIDFVSKPVTRAVTLR